MKKVILCIILVFSLVFLGCYSDDDGDSFRFIQLEIEDAITLENESNYVVGDTIFFELKFSRYLEERGFSNLLDIYETTDSDEFSYSFGVLKFSSFTNNFDRIAIDSDFIFIEKGIGFDGFSGTAAVLNQEQNEYESRVGLILQEAGNFRFDFEFITLFPEFVQGKVNLDIQHRFTTAQPEDFEFTVTE